MRKLWKNDESSENSQSNVLHGKDELLHKDCSKDRVETANHYSKEHVEHRECPKTTEFSLQEFACGWGSAFINITVTYPIYKVIFRQMIEGVAVDKAIRQVSNEGFYYLYRGVLPPLCQKTTSLSIMFGLYDQCKKTLCENNVPLVASKAIAGLVSGSVEAVLTPFERVQTLMQHREYHSQFQNTAHAFRNIFSMYGIKEFYRGLVPILFRNGPSNVCFFLLRDQAKAALPSHDSTLKQSSQEFFTGAFIGAVTSTLFYPLNVVKINMQSRLGGDFQGFVSVFIRIFRERGLRNMYRGVHINYTRAFLSWGIVNASYERLKYLFFS